MCVINVRLLLGFAFLPAGLKKLLGQPFTDPQNTGSFHEFLHAFHATGFFYQFVGIVQLTIAVLLLTQKYSTLGALMALPVFGTIAVFCWSTQVVFTATMVTLMLLATIGLVGWDYGKWRGVFDGRDAEGSDHHEVHSPPVDMQLWQRCGSAIVAVYVGICIYTQGIYRPRGVELQNPAFYIFPLIALLPVVTFAIEQVRRNKYAGNVSD